MLQLYPKMSARHFANQNHVLEFIVWRIRSRAFSEILPGSGIEAKLNILAKLVFASK